MLTKRKILFLVSSLIFLTSLKESNLKEIHVSGYTTMVDIDEKIPVVLNVAQGDLSKYMTLKMYMNDAIVKNVVMLGNEINETIFYLPAINKENKKVKIEIIINYKDYDLYADTSGIFNYYSPSYNIVTNESINDLVRLKSTNPVKVEFELRRTSFSSKNIYEIITLCGKTFNLNDSRIIDTSYFRIYSHYLLQSIDLCEFRVYSDFIGSNLLFKDDYVTTDLSVSQLNEVTFTVDFEYKYYVDNITGSINEEYYNGCDYELMPFFVPYYIKDEIIPYEVIFYDIGANHSTYIYRNYFVQDSNNLTNSFSYEYKLFDNIIKDVNYE